MRPFLINPKRLSSPEDQTGIPPSPENKPKTNLNMTPIRVSFRQFPSHFFRIPPSARPGQTGYFAGRENIGHQQQMLSVLLHSTYRQDGRAGCLPLPFESQAKLFPRIGISFPGYSIPQTASLPIHDRISSAKEG